jgi:hypothetical protein
MTCVFRGSPSLPSVTSPPDKSSVGITPTSSIKSQEKKFIANAAQKVAEEGFFKVSKLFKKKRLGTKYIQ